MTAPATLPLPTLKEAALTKALLEAAFDGEDEDLLKLLNKGKDMMKNAVRIVVDLDLDGS